MDLARLIVWLSPDICDPPHRVTHVERFEALRDDIAERGWSADSPACIGYRLDGRIQLVSGSHRWAACHALGQRIPVCLLPYEVVERIHGTDVWLEMLAACPTAGQQPRHAPNEARPRP